MTERPGCAVVCSPPSRFVVGFDCGVEVVGDEVDHASSASFEEVEDAVPASG